MRNKVAKKIKRVSTIVGMDYRRAKMLWKALPRNKRNYIMRRNDAIIKGMIDKKEKESKNVG